MTTQIEYYDGSETEPDICIYHGPGCADGFGAAWAIRQKWPKCEFMPAQYGDEPPETSGKHVLIVDFSYPGPVLEEMAKFAASVVVLDHHKTAMEDLAALLEVKVIQGEFDMSKSGARLAWEYAWGPAAATPWIIQYVEDRDLWKFQHAATKAVHAFLTSYTWDFAMWDLFAKHMESPGPLNEIISEGEAIIRAMNRLRASCVASTRREMVIGGHLVPVANVPYAMASDAANEMADGYPFAATYVDRDDGMRQFSLRRRESEVDVSEIARAYGGGGHAAAAGFEAPRGWEGDLVGQINGIDIIADPPHPGLSQVPLSPGTGKVGV